MKNFKNILIIATLFVASVAHAKQVGKKVASQPTVQTQPVKAKTFTQLYNEVKNAKNAWDPKTQLLSSVFVTNLVNDAKTAHINPNELNFLFLLARDCHAQFTGSTKDIQILESLDQQRFIHTLDFK